jgi:gliding motility-associated-like protein
MLTNTRRIRARVQGKYYVTVSAANGAVSHKDSSFVKVLERPVPFLTDTALCAGSSVFLDAGNNGMRYTWGTGDKTRRLRVNAEGRYTVKISNGKCVLFDTAYVKVLGIVNPFPEKEITYCLNDPPKILGVKPVAGCTFEWSNGATSPTITATSEGMYSLTIRHPRCPEARDSVRLKFRACDCEIIVPKSFTPNEDNRNDLFFPVLSCEYLSFNLTITDRWGNTVYESTNPAGKWDGRYKGNLCPEDIYVYRIESQEKSSRKKVVSEGYISLFR